MKIQEFLFSRYAAPSKLKDTLQHAAAVRSELMIGCKPQQQSMRMSHCENLIALSWVRDINVVNLVYSPDLFWLL